MQAELKTTQQNQLDTAPKNDQASVAPKPAEVDGLGGVKLELTEAELQEAVDYNKSQRLTPDQVKHYQLLVGAPSDGAMGPTTTRAVYTYQLCHAGLKPDGKMGPGTRAALDAEYQGRLSRDPGPAVELTDEKIAAAVKYNQHRFEDVELIKEIQRKVGIKDDGDFGADTVKAIWAWQAANGLSADGRVGPRTIEVMGVGMHSEENKQKSENAGQKKTEQTEQTEQADIPQGNVTSHISWAEFQSHDGVGVPAELRDNVRALCAELEIIRAAFGGASLSINSGYRSPAWNKHVGGAKNSQHKMGTACDFNISGVRPATVRKKVEELIKEGKVKQGGLGAYAGFTHYDIRGYRARW